MTAEDAAAIRWTNLCGSLSHNAAWKSFRHAASFERISLMESFKGSKDQRTAQRRYSSTLFPALLPRPHLSCGHYHRNLTKENIVCAVRNVRLGLGSL